MILQMQIFIRKWNPKEQNAPLDEYGNHLLTKCWHWE